MNMKTNSVTFCGAIAGLSLLCVALACGSGGYDTDKANKLVSDGNAAVEDAKKYITEAEEKKESMLRTDISRLAEARTLANEAIRAYDQAEDKLKESAAKFEEASKLNLADKYKEYLTLAVKEKNKRVELVEALKSIPQALIDSQSRESFISRANAATQKAERLKQEADDLQGQEDKVQKDNPDVFRKS